VIGLAVNSAITETYWQIGRDIVEFEQEGKSRAEYGTGLILKLARDLTLRHGRGSAAAMSNPGGFQFCRLSEEPLFNEVGDIREDVSFAQLADFVWSAETGEGYMGDAEHRFQTNPVCDRSVRSRVLQNASITQRSETSTRRRSSPARAGWTGRRK